MGFRVWGLGFRVWGLGFRLSLSASNHSLLAPSQLPTRVGRVPNTPAPNITLPNILGAFRVNKVYGAGGQVSLASPFLLAFENPVQHP